MYSSIMVTPNGVRWVPSITGSGSEGSTPLWSINCSENPPWRRRYWWVPSITGSGSEGSTPLWSINWSENPPWRRCYWVYIPPAGYYPHGGQRPHALFAIGYYSVLVWYLPIYGLPVLHIFIYHNILGERLTDECDTLSCDLIPLPVTHPVNNIYFLNWTWMKFI
jgi:hypothetical protein